MSNIQTTGEGEWAGPETTEALITRLRLLLSIQLPAAGLLFTATMRPLLRIELASGGFAALSPGLVVSFAGGCTLIIRITVWLDLPKQLGAIRTQPQRME
jgi:hypothetical protein